MRNPFVRSARKAGGKKLRLGLSFFGALALALSALTIVPASPAMAGCAKPFNWGGAEVQIDNCPGDGAQSWGWVFGSRDYLWTDVYVRSASGEEAYFTASAGQSAVAEWWFDVKTVAICNTKFFTWIPPAPIIHCSPHMPV